MLLLAQDTEGDGTGMSDAQLRDEALTIFLAGHETTANALTWTWYLLSQHPDVEARLHAELDSALGGRRPAFEDLPNLPYTRMVLSESMRLYPPAWAIGRRALKSFNAMGYEISAGSVVLMSQYIMHRDERFFPSLSGSILSDGRRSRRRSGRGFRTSRLAVARAYVSVSSSRGWRGFCCWRQSRSNGECGSTLVRSSIFSPSSHYDPSMECE
jgi:hypothetical protein